jgi:hypothetical protein
MAGQTRSRNTRGHGRSSRDDRLQPVLATAPAAASGSSATSSSANGSTGMTGPAPDLPTRSTYRLLLMRGLAPDEAANLTAFMSGIHVGEQHWKLREVNQLLFLRDMQRTGRIGDSH